MRTCLTKFSRIFECGADWSPKVQKCVNHKCKSCRSRQELSNEYLLAKFGFDTAENEPLKVCQKLAKSQKKSQKKTQYFFLPLRCCFRGADRRTSFCDGGDMQLKSAAPMVTRSCGAEPSLLISSDRIQNTRRYRRRYSRKRAKFCRKFAKIWQLPYGRSAPRTLSLWTRGVKNPSGLIPRYPHEECFRGLTCSSLLTALETKDRAYDF